MEWRDTAIVLATRPYGEHGQLCTVLSRKNGRYLGLVRGRTARQTCQPGTTVAATWRARLAEHLGSLTVEPIRTTASELFDRPLPLAALASACALCEAACAERQPFPDLYDGLLALLDHLSTPHWDAVYVRWELGLLDATGSGLDLSACAVTGSSIDLAYVSPRTGRAVSAKAGQPYAGRLLRLPGFLIGQGEADPGEVMAGLRLAGHFIDRELSNGKTGGLPAVRRRLAASYARRYNVKRAAEDQ